MEVIKRDGRREPVSFDKITARIQALKNNSPVLTHVDEIKVAQKVIDTLYSGISTSKLDDESVNITSPMIIDHYEYGELASRIAISNYHKNNIHDVARITGKFLEDVEKKLFLHTVEALCKNVNALGEISPRVSEKFADFVGAHSDELESLIDYSRDYQYDVPGFQILKSKYLLSVRENNNLVTTIERPQHMIMRVAISIHMHPHSDNVTVKDHKELMKFISETYNLMSQLYFTHATPTLFNAGTESQQMSSCFLTTVPEDSIDGIYDWYKNCANISKWAGGIGSHIHNLRSRGSYIRGTGGVSNGIVPWLKVASESAGAVDQGGNKRPGSHAIYLEPWHADFLEFVSLKKPRGDDNERAKKLFYAAWLPDEFMRAVEQGEEWYFMCPSVSKGLSEVHGEEFSALYRKYIAEGKYVKSMPAAEVWREIVESIAETGGPYMMSKDNCNKMSNQQNLGTIKSSNLCAEIVEYSSADETAVCNLASICLNKFCVKPGVFDFDKLGEVTRVCTRNLNKIIDIEFYPTAESERSNKRHRPIGIGVQGLADTFALMGMPFDSAEALKLDARIFETIYYHALDESRVLAEKHGPYDSYEGSPASRGVLQFDYHPEFRFSSDESQKRWALLKENLASGKTKLRNSLLIALMPTASTSTVMGNSPCFEPYNGMIYKRRQLGENIIVNKFLMKELCEKGLWTEEVKSALKQSQTGGISEISSIPKSIRDKYKTVWEMSPKVILEHAAARAPFVDQSQSMNLFVPTPTVKLMTQIYFYGWRKGLKTMSYYVRSTPAMDAQKVTVVEKKKEVVGEVCRMEDDCVVCSS